MAVYFNSLKTLLNNYAVERRNKPSMFVGEKVAPFVPVEKDSNNFPVWGEENLEISGSGGFRAPSTQAEQCTQTYSTDKYTCLERAFESPLDEREQQNAQPEFRVEQHKTNLVTDRQLLNLDYVLSQKLFNATTFSGYYAALSGTDKWSSAASDPRVQADIARNSVYLAGVVDPNELKLLVNTATFIQLQRNIVLKDIIKYTNPGAANLSKELIAQALGIKEVIVGATVYKNTAGAHAALWGNYALFFHNDEVTNLEDVSTCKTFIQREKDIRIDVRHNNDILSNIWRARWDYDVKVTAASSGYLFGTVI